MPAAKSKRVTLQSELRELNADIAERKKYYREQEALIKEAVDRGNTTLMSLHHDILAAKQELRSIKTDIRTAAQDKVMLNEDLDAIRSEIEATISNGNIFVGVSPAFG
jgi:chromosome segregation ATPase